MFGNIVLGNKEIPLKVTATTSIRYKSIFKQDLTKELVKLDEVKLDSEYVEVLDMISQLAYVMHCQATNTIKEASADSYLDWLDEFEPGVFEDEKVIKKIFALWRNDSKCLDELKNQESPQPE